MIQWWLLRDVNVTMLNGGKWVNGKIIIKKTIINYILKFYIFFDIYLFF